MQQAALLFHADQTWPALTINDLNHTCCTRVGGLKTASSWVPKRAARKPCLQPTLQHLLKHEEQDNKQTQILPGIVGTTSDSISMQTAQNAEMENQGFYGFHATSRNVQSEKAREES